MERSIKIPAIITLCVYALVLTGIIILCVLVPQRPMPDMYGGWILAALFTPVLGLSFYYNFILKD